MIDDEEYEGLPPDVGDTARRELVDSTKKIVIAESDLQRSATVADMFRAAIDSSRTLHKENGYVPRLRAIFRGEAA